jgi:hypothetical protein
MTHREERLAIEAPVPELSVASVYERIRLPGATEF